MTPGPAQALSNLATAEETKGKGLSLKCGKDMMRLYALAFFTVVSVAAIQLGCSSTPLTSPTGSTISMTSDRNVLPLNGQATVRAVVIESGGTPVHNGTVVSFTSTLGTFNPPDATTVNGVATTVFNAGGISGTSVIHAFSGGARTGSGNTSSGGVEIKIGAAAAGSLTLSATPSSVSQSGGTVTVAAQVLDPSGNPLPGVNVSFATDAGQLNPTTSLSDSNGIARTQLTTSQTSKVTATAGTATKDVTVTVSTAPALQIDASPNPATEGTPVSITVTATSGNTTAPRQVQTLTVDFGDGTAETRSNVTGTAAYTHVYRAGGFTITATATDVAGNTGVASRALTVNAATLPTVTVTANPNPVPNSSNGLTTLSISASSGAAPLRNVTMRLPNGEVIYSGTGNGSVAYRFTGGPGAYSVIGTATDANGNTGTTTTSVVVQ